MMMMIIIITIIIIIVIIIIIIIIIIVIMREDVPGAVPCRAPSPGGGGLWSLARADCLSVYRPICLSAVFLLN